MPPHNLLLFFMGASLLWVGWFGFNAGSALAANQSASMALMVTHISGCAGGLSWMLLEWALKGMLKKKRKNEKENSRMKKKRRRKKNALENVC